MARDLNRGLMILVAQDVKDYLDRVLAMLQQLGDAAAPFGARVAPYILLLLLNLLVISVVVATLLGVVAVLFDVDGKRSIGKLRRRLERFRKALSETNVNEGDWPSVHSSLLGRQRHWNCLQCRLGWATELTCNTGRIKRRTFWS